MEIRQHVRWILSQAFGRAPSTTLAQGVFPWGSGWPREAHGGKGDKAFRRDGKVPAACGLSPLLCHHSPSAALEQEHSVAAAHPAWERVCSRSLQPGCWILTAPSALHPITPEAPSSPLNTAPSHGMRPWYPLKGCQLCPPHRATATSPSGSHSPHQSDP